MVELASGLKALGIPRLTKIVTAHRLPGSNNQPGFTFSGVFSGSGPAVPGSSFFTEIFTVPAAMKHNPV